MIDLPTLMRAIDLFTQHFYIKVNFSLLQTVCSLTKSGERTGKEKMTKITSRCIICGKFFDSKKELKHHKDKNHRITNSRIMTRRIFQEIATKPAAKIHYQQEND
jgi:hypothetical protein